MREFVSSVAYSALALVTPGKGVTRSINGDAIRFPARWFRYYSTSYQPHTYDFLRSKCSPGTLVIDVGAHIGLFTVVMARAVGDEGRVASYEPTPETFQVLLDTISLNGCDHIVDAHAQAVAHSGGPRQFYSTGMAGTNANSLIGHDGSTQAVVVDSVSIDEIVQRSALAVSCLKIDAEGAELSVLEGAVEVLGAHQPSIALDVHPAAIGRAGRTTGELWDLMTSAGMEVWDGHRRLDRASFCSVQHTFDVQVVHRDRDGARHRS